MILIKSARYIYSEELRNAQPILTPTSGQSYTMVWKRYVTAHFFYSDIFLQVQFRSSDAQAGKTFNNGEKMAD